MQIAVVATARKLAVLCWHLIVKGEDYAYGRPSLLTQKLRKLELRAGMPSRRGQRGSTHAYNLKEVRARERALSEQGEIAYKQLVADWQAKATGTRTGTGAATGARLWGRQAAILRGGASIPDAPLFGPGSPAPTTKRNARRVR